MKICSKCKVNKSLDQFRIRKERKSGYRSDCKECEYKYSQLNRREYFNKYQRDRAKDYPSIQEQLDLQYWDKINGTNKWQQAINAVKQKYPK